MSTTTLKQWGNGMGVIIPQEIIEKSRIQENDILELAAVDGVITLQKNGGNKTKSTAQPSFSAVSIDTVGFKFDREKANER
ncbi:MAG: AbrB/MazE/SpoVT family DNA-binding domain-containing protein [Spirochaetes bacterium]|nr:AbrB/MazE/SpoVT family DNA-binding domain-containing protein [Spirochaetota bacterium]